MHVFAYMCIWPRYACCTSPYTYVNIRICSLHIRICSAYCQRQISTWSICFAKIRHIRICRYVIYVSAVDTVRGRDLYTYPLREVIYVFCDSMNHKLLSKHMYIHTHARARLNICTYTHTRARKCTHVHTYTYIYTYFCIQVRML